MVIVLAMPIYGSSIVIHSPTSAAPVTAASGADVQFSVTWDVTDHPDFNATNGVILKVALDNPQLNGRFMYSMSASGGWEGSKTYNGTISAPSQEGIYDLTIYLYSCKPGCTSDPMLCKDKLLLSATQAGAVQVGTPSHTVDTPAAPIGPATANVGEDVVFSTTAETCSQGHPLHYQFEFGDEGSSGWSTATTAAHAFQTERLYRVRVRASCQWNPSDWITSEWSPPALIKIGTDAPPQNVNQVGSCMTQDQAVGIAVSGSYAYIADREGGLQIVDISDPTHLFVVGKIKDDDWEGWAYDVAISGHYVYIAHGDGGLRVIDVSIPSDPVEVGNCPANEWIQKICLAGDYLYTADFPYGVIDISAPSNPHLVGQGSSDSGADALAVYGQYLYTLDWLGTLTVSDISHPTDPVMVGQEFVGHDANGIVVTDGYAYIAAGDDGLVILDVKNPSSIVTVGQCLLPGYAEDVMVSGRYAYVAAGVAGMRVVDVSDVYHPKEVGSYDTRDYATDVTFDGQYIYVADGVDGLVILEFLNSGSSANRSPDTKIESAEVDETKGTAKFTWTGSDDTTPVEDLTYSYRLVRPGPSYDDWSPWSKDTSKSYSGLTAGSYKFEVRAKDADGAIDGSPASKVFGVIMEVSGRGIIKGWVTSAASGSGIGGAMLFLDPDPLDSCPITKSTGYFSFSVPPGRYVLTAKVGAHISSKTRISVGAGQTVVVNLKISNAPPNPPQSGLQQLKWDGKSVLQPHGRAFGAVGLQATISDPDGDRVRLEVEVFLQQGDNQLKEVQEIRSDFVDSGDKATIFIDLPNGNYAWRARVQDEAEAYSQWVDYGESDGIDFMVRPAVVRNASAIGGDGEIALFFSTPEKVETIQDLIVKRKSGGVPRDFADGEEVFRINKATLRSGALWSSPYPISFVDRDLSNGTTYFYRYFVVDKDGTPWPCSIISSTKKGSQIMECTPQSLGNNARNGIATKWACLFAGDDYRSQYTQYMFMKTITYWWQVPSRNVEIVSAGKDSTPLMVWSYLKSIARSVDGDDIVIIHFASHGGPGVTYFNYENGEFIMRESEGQGLFWSQSASPDQPYLYDYQLAFMLRQFPSAATKIVIVDACYSGGFLAELKYVANTWILTAAGKDELARGSLWHLFTKGLVGAIDGSGGDADTNSDGKISIREAFDAAYAHVSGSDWLFRGASWMSGVLRWVPIVEEMPYSPCHPQMWPLEGDFIVVPQASRLGEALVLFICSPVEVTVTDARGNRFNRRINEINGAYSIQEDGNLDGVIDDKYVIPNPSESVFLVSVQPKPEAKPTSHFAILWPHSDHSITVLADGSSINDVPSMPLEIDLARNTPSKEPRLGKTWIFFFEEGIAVGFDQVLVSGTTTINAMDLASPVHLSRSFVPISDLYCVSSTAISSGDVSIRVCYDDTDLSEEQEKDLRVWAFDDLGRTLPGRSSSDIENNVVSCQVPELPHYFVVGYESREMPSGQALSCSPNPIPTGGCVFWLNLPENITQAELMIFNVTGRPVFETPLDVNSTRFPSAGTWNPVDQDGIPLANGPYVYVLIADGKVIGQGKMVIQR